MHVRRRLGLVLIVTAVLAVAGYALARPASTPKAAGLTRSSSGPLGGDHSQELSYIRAADRTALRTPACQSLNATTPPVSHGSPSGRLLSILGVLRRPATAADRLPSALQGGGYAWGIYVRYIRLARVKDGVSYYIVPAASPDSGPTRLPKRCHAAMVAALQAELPHIPVQLRAPTLALQAREWDQQRLLAEQASKHVVCLLFNSADASGGTCGAATSEIRDKGMISSAGPLSGIVPDGVAIVTVHYPARDGLAAHTATSDVVGDVFATSIRSRHQQLPAMIWRSAQGKIIKTVPAGREPMSSSGFCTAASSNHC